MVAQIAGRAQHSAQGFRTDAFNFFNHPTWINPRQTSMKANGRPITEPPRSQAGVPGVRLFCISAKYIFKPVFFHR